MTTLTELPGDEPTTHKSRMQVRISLLTLKSEPGGEILQTDFFFVELLK